MKILVFGSLNIDHVYQVKKIVLEKETIQALSYQTYCGGKGLNQAIACAQAEGDVYFAGCLGKDGQSLKAQLQAHNIHTDYLMDIDEANGHAIIQVDETGQNSIIVYGGSNQKITQAQILDTLENFEQGDYIILSNEINELHVIMDHARQKGMKIVFNASPITKEIFDLPYEKIDYLLINETEGLALTGFSNPQQIITDLTMKYRGLSVIITLGEHGCYFKNHFTIEYQSAFKTKAVDTVGAGDTFLGYFATSVASGLSIKRSMEMASLASSIAITRHGASSSIPSLKEVLDKKKEIG